MFSSRCISVGFSRYLSASTTTSGVIVRTWTLPAVSAADKLVVLENTKSKYAVPNGKQDAMITSAFGKSQVRFAHSDVSVPDFSDYRRDSTKDANQPASQVGRRAFTYMIVGGYGVAGLYAGKHIVRSLLSVMNPTKDVLALATVEVDLKKIPEGKTLTVKWRGKPLFVRHRAMNEVDQVRGVDVASLRDPEGDEVRVSRADWLVVVAICTHLGCVPIADQGDFGGYYCPCHGSHYDASGRIRKGPAPLNLEVPPYKFSDEHTLLIG